FVAAGGGSIGVLLGGILTDTINWHWIFLVNFPIGVLVYLLSLRLLPTDRGPAAAGRLDIAGALTVTGALMLAVYAIVNGNQAGWTSTQTLGLLGGAVGLVLFVRAPVHGHFVVDVLPSMILLGFRAGTAFSPVLLAAMSDVAPEESGLPSGLVNTAFMMGGALGLAVLASLAASRSDSLRSSGEGSLSALTGGYHLAFVVGSLFAAAAATI